MGFAQNVKANQLAKEAQDARAQGRQVMMVKLNFPASKADFSGEVVDWSMMVEAVEAQGWALYQLAGMSDPKGRPEAVCLFRLR